MIFGPSALNYLGIILELENTFAVLFLEKSREYLVRQCLFLLIY